jgi:glucose-1-phosphate thymidylyltransferase
MNRAVKAVILAAGAGNRMRRSHSSAMLTEEQRAVADQGNKAMIPFDRPFLDYVLSGLADAGISQVCLVVGPRNQEIRNHYIGGVTLSRLSIAFAEQAEPRGTADAVQAARPFAADDLFLVLNADNYYPVQSYRALLEFGAPALPGFERESLVRLGNIERERVAHYALLQVDSDGFLADIVEKPDDSAFAYLGEHALVSMNLWLFSPTIFEACERVPTSVRGERELPQAVRFAVRELGMRFKVLPVTLGVLDLSNRGDIAAVGKRLKDIEVSL